MPVSVVWITAAVRTPRMLTQVSTSTEAMASRRCGDRPIWMSPLGRCAVQPMNTSGVSVGTNTAVKRANATATAAMVPVWITVNRVQPYR